MTSADQDPHPKIPSYLESGVEDVTEEDDYDKIKNSYDVLTNVKIKM